MKDLTNYNTYHIKTFCKDIVYPNDIKELKKYLKEKHYILGSGSNVILPDNYFEGIIIKLDRLNKFYFTNNKVIAYAGINLNYLIKELIKNGYNNLCNLYGIPGTLGGAILGNAGCYNTCIFDYIDSVLILDNDKVYLKKKADIKYGYRYSEFKNKNIVILGCILNIEKLNIDEDKIIKDNLLKRKNTQPLEYFNAGSVFKNPEGLSAGKLIDECNLKGTKVNSAMVSEKHANFIINLKNAQSSDIIKLIDLIKEEVYKKKNIKLELEQVIVKW